MLENPLRMGVFVVIRTDHPFTQEDLADYNLHPGGGGENYLLYRAYHLVAVEAPSLLRKLFSMGSRQARRCGHRSPTVSRSNAMSHKAQRSLTTW